MPRKFLLGIIVSAVVIIAVASGWTLFNSSPRSSPPSPTLSPSPKTTPYPTVSETPSPSSTLEPTPPAVSQPQVRDAIMKFIVSNHNESGSYAQNFIWTGGRVTTGLMGAETYEYLSNGWNVTIHYPVVPNSVYAITAKYISPISEIWPQKVILYWEGTWQNGTILEASYEFTP